jgi:outer membrane protein OmpA-like peptidoglycan-associated protein
MLGSVFGDRQAAAVDHIAASSGVSKGSASKILGLTAPLMAAMVGREAKTRGLGGAGVASMLVGQKSSVDSALAGGRLNDLFGERAGWSKEATDFRTTTGSVRPTGIPAGRRPGLSLVLLGAAALAALLFLFRGRRPETPAVPEGPKVGRVETPKMEAPKAPQVFGGGPVDPADQLKRFFADPNAHVPERVVLDGVFFSPSSMSLSPTAQQSLTPIATALKQDPNAKVRIEAFTDASGDATNDQRLSTQRAYSVRDVLVQEGIDPSRISVAGFGSERPIAPADTPEGRAKNSRVELVVTER